MADALSELARDGSLRVAFNLGNRALVQTDEAGEFRGVSPALARRLAERLGLPLEPVLYPGAGKVFEAALEDAWDVGFLAVDAKRAERLSFTRPYHAIEACYAVRTDAPFRSADDADRPGVRILTSVGSAYALHLSRTLQQATFTQAGTPEESFAAFADGPYDMVAGVRASLERHFADTPGIRLLPGALTRVEQAMVLPGPDHPLIGALDAFVADALEDGFVQAALNAGT